MGYSLFYESLFDKLEVTTDVTQSNQMIDDLLTDQFHMEQFTYIAERLDLRCPRQHASGSNLTDLWIRIGDGSTHQYNDLPIIVAGVEPAP